jgi:hypothetical protein
MESGNSKSLSSLVRPSFQCLVAVLLIRVTEDEKVSLDELQEKIAEIEDYVQSTDVAAMQSTWIYVGFLQAC